MTHGKVATYNNGCRCQDCRSAAAAARRRHRSLHRREPRRTPTGTPRSFEYGEWRDRAACARTPIDVFFPTRPVFAEAKALCAACPVRAECLTFALETDQPDGVWGGLSFTERERVRVSQRTSAHVVFVLRTNGSVTA